MTGSSESNTAYCINCGEEIAADTQFCPKCGSNQDPSEFQEDTEETNHGGFTSWAIGFRPGKTGRNILVGFAYFIFYYIGAPLLLYSYTQQKPEKAKYVAYIGGGFLLLMSLAAFVQGGRRGIIAGVIALLLGLFFLPIVRQKSGVGDLPGIDIDKSARRSFIVGSGYALGSMALVGAALPKVENTNTDGSGGSSETGSSGTGSSRSEDEYPNAWYYDEDTGILFENTPEAELDSTGSLYILGSITNKSDNNYEYVQITFDVLDASGSKIADAIANTSGLDAGQSWRYEALAASADNVDSYELSDVTAY